MTVIPIMPKTQGLETHRAGQVVVDQDTIIENGCVQVKNGWIVQVGVYNSKTMEGRIFDHGSGCLIPSLINAHTHLELSALKGKLTVDRGFQQWVKELIDVRDQIGNNGLLKAIPSAVNDLMDSGSLVVGDISSLGIVDAPLRKTCLSGVLFREYLGNIIPETKMDDIHPSLNLSWAGHAPHTTSPELLLNLKNRCRKNGLPFSIHLSESLEEVEFITTGKGQWADFLTLRGIDTSSWNIPCSSPVNHLDRLGVLDSKTLVVHLIRVGKSDIKILKHKNPMICLCLRSNNTLHNTLPPVDLMMAEGLSLCLGTDSLASTESLSIFDEMRFLATHFPRINPKDMFRMATVNGAKALGCNAVFGSLEPGKSGNMNYLPALTGNNHTIFESLVS